MGDDNNSHTATDSSNLEAWNNNQDLTQSDFQRPSEQLQPFRGLACYVSKFPTKEFFMQLGIRENGS